MERERQKAAMEAILFTMGNSVEADRIAEALETTEEEVHELAKELSESYERENRGFRLLRLEDSYQLCTKHEFYETLIRIASIPRKINLTDALLETLAIIAYKQPVTRLEIEKIRGVNSDHSVNRLLDYELITEVGRLDAPGRPIVFGTSENFLRHFGVSSIDELPQPGPLLQEGFREEAEQEAALRFPDSEFGKESSAQESAEPNEDGQEDAEQNEFGQESAEQESGEPNEAGQGDAEQDESPQESAGQETPEEDSTDPRETGGKLPEEETESEAGTSVGI